VLRERIWTYCNEGYHDANWFFPAVPPWGGSENKDSQDAKNETYVGRDWLHPAKDCGERCFRIWMRIRGLFRDCRNPVVVFEVILQELRCGVFFEPLGILVRKLSGVENEG
jgi:hypothetical protein